MKKEKAKILRSDLLEVYLKWDDSTSIVFLKLYILDILRIAELCKSSGNLYYYNELRWFIEQTIAENKHFNKIDFDRVLPRINLKTKAKWELQGISQKAL